VIAIIAILAALLLPTLTLAKQRAQAVKCMSNMRQVSLGWFMYDADSRGYFPANEEGDLTTVNYWTPPPPVLPWVNGWLDYAGGVVGGDGLASDTDNNYLVSGTYASLGAYVKNAGAYKCPADPSCDHGSGQKPRVRSYAMNQAIGCTMDGTAGSSSGAYGQTGGWLSGNGSQGGAGPWKVYIKEADMTRPSPANLWLLIDEHCDSINDGAFAVQMDPISNTSANWIDHPSCLHAGACAFTFADGHTVIHKWLDPQWKTVLRYAPLFQTGWGQTAISDRSGFRTTDMRWIAEHTTAYSNPAQNYNFTMVPD
jgi:type II secretory pathway pseudopilin PulG